jgi:cardiolipin synthase
MNHRNQTCAKAATCSLILGALLTGCASGPDARRVNGENSAGIYQEVTVQGPDHPNTRLRKVAGVSQAAALYGRSIYVDPINRPISNAASLVSFTWKSTTGFVRRLSVNNIEMPSLGNTPIPDVGYGEGMDLEQWEKDLDRIVGHKSSTGKIDFLVDGEQYFTRMLEVFGGAENSIDIRTYIFDNDDFGVEVADVLKDKSKDVKVRIQLDALGNLLAMQTDSDSQPTGHTGPLSMSNYLRKDSNVRVRNRANPHFYMGDHTKTTIVDGKTAFVGGMNIGREYRYDWHDLMMEVSGPVVDQLQYDSDKAWARAGVFGDAANFLRILGGRKKRADIEGYPVRTLYTRNFDSQIYRAQLEAIRRSKSYILIENSYFSDDLMTYELARARRRGVDVRIILPTRGNHGPVHASNQVAINTLLDHGIRVYVYPGMSHVKAAIFDGWACVGSANYDKLSLEVNKELNLATSDADTVNSLLNEVFLTDIAMSQEITEPVQVAFAQAFLEKAVDEFL